MSSRENSRSSNVFPIEITSSPLDIDAIRLLSGSSYISTSVHSSYLEDPITIVSDFINLRDIKAEIDFTTVQYIAEGGFGKVSSARLQNGSEVAIKEIKEEVYTEYYTEDTMLNRIWNEAANFIKVKGNPKFTELLGIYLNDINRPCLSMAIVMELADGDLEKYKNAIADNKEVKLSYSNIRYLALEMFYIIEACKQVKIGYVDFHLGNIHIKLQDTDF
jgi:serine/threonine protein kinase